MRDIIDFFKSFSKSKGGIEALIISMLLSFGLASTVGIVPTVLCDRYARLHHGWDGQPCYGYEHNLMPAACKEGGDDAQAGSACMTLVQNLLLFVFNPVVGSQSDVQGRRGFLLMGILLFALSPSVLVAMQHFEKLNPFFYFVADSTKGLVSYMSLIFAAMADSSTEKFRAASYAMIMAGFYSGFCIAPSLVLLMSHETAAIFSCCLCLTAFLFAVAFFPETLPEATAEVAAVRMEHSVPINVEQNRIEDSPSTRLLPVEQDIRHADSNGSAAEEGQHEDQCNLFRISNKISTILLRPFREMAILGRSPFMRILTLASFLSAAVYSTDVSLVLFYIEDHLNVGDSDIAQMFFFMGILGVLLQALGIQPLVNLLGEKGLLIVSFLSGTLHNFLYGAAKSKIGITWALSFSQLTKLNYPILNSLASKGVGVDEQGQVQGAIFAMNALAGAMGPVSMNYIYQKTKNTHLGPGTMFLLASFLYFLGTVCVSLIQIPERIILENGDSYDSQDCEALADPGSPRRNISRYNRIEETGP